MAVNNVLIDKDENILNPKIPRYENLKSFSTSEQYVGQWSDGKTLYKKILEVGAVSTTEVQVNLNVPDVDKVVAFEGGGYMASGGHFLPWNFENSGGFTSCYYQANNKRFLLQVSTTSYNLSSGHIIVFYTKTN